MKVWAPEVTPGPSPDMKNGPFLFCGIPAHTQSKLVRGSGCALMSINCLQLLIENTYCKYIHVFKKIGLCTILSGRTATST